MVKIRRPSEAARSCRVYEKDLMISLKFEIRFIRVIEVAVPASFFLR